MLCLSDIQLFLLLLWKMAPRWVRQGYGLVPLAAGKKALSSDLCSCVAHHVLTGLCGNSVSFWLTSVCSVSLLCHCLWFGLSAWPATVKFSLASWLLSSCEHHRPLWGSALSSPNPGQVWLSSSLSQTLLQAHHRDSAVSDMQPHQGHMETSRSYPSHTNSSSHQKPNFSQIMLSHQIVLQGDPQKLGQCNLWRWASSRVPNTKQTAASPLRFSITWLTLLPHSELMSPMKSSGHILILLLFSLLSSFQSPRPEEGMFLFLPLPVCPGLLLSNLSQKRRIPSSSLFFLLLLNSALWLSLKSQWGVWREA